MEGDDRITLKEFFGQMLEQGEGKLKEGDYMRLGKFLQEHYNKEPESETKRSINLEESGNDFEIMFRCSDNETWTAYNIGELIYKKCSSDHCDKLHLHAIGLCETDIGYYCEIEMENLGEGVDYLIPEFVTEVSMEEHTYKTKQIKDYLISMNNQKTYRRTHLLKDIRTKLIGQICRRILFKILQKNPMNIDP